MKLLIALLVVLSSICAQAGIRRVRVAEPCPDTFGEWVKFREDSAYRFTLMTSKESDQIGRWAQERLEHFEKCRKDRAALFEKNPGLDVCWKATLDWLKALKPFRSNRTGVLYTDETEEQVAKEPKMRLGMNVTDEEYYRRTSQFTAIPDDILAASDFLRALTKPKQMEKVYAELEKLNEARKKKGEPEIQYAQFKGNVKASDSNTLVRLLLYVPGEPSKWFSIGLPSDSGMTTPQWSAVGVKKTNGRTDVYFKDHWRKYDKTEGQDPHYKTSFEDVKEGKFGDACWKCHKSGLLALPVDDSMTERDRVQTRKFNELIAEVGLSGSGGFYNPEQLAPGLGGDDSAEKGLKELREKIYPYCIADSLPYNSKGNTKAEFDLFNGAVNKQKILKAMNCSSCHDGKQRGLLTVPLGDVVYRYIDEHRMPPGSKLTADEIKVLKRCLNLEFSGMVDNNEYSRIQEREWGGSSSQPRELPKWYQGVESVPSVKGLIPGRFVRHMTETSCGTPNFEQAPPPRPAEGH